MKQAWNKGKLAFLVFSHFALAYPDTQKFCLELSGVSESDNHCGGLSGRKKEWHRWDNGKRHGNPPSIWIPTFIL